jgi:GGDEF domain-containing protein
VSGATAATRARVIAGQKLRETVRRDTPLAHMGEADFLIADVFDAPDPSALIERIRSALAAPPSRVRASIGTVSTPLQPLVSRPPHAVLDELLAIATAAMHEARRAGGDQHRLIVNPPLTALDEPESDWPPDERRA